MHFFLHMWMRRYPALGALVILLVIARFAFTIQRMNRSSGPDPAGPPTYRAASAEIDAMRHKPTATTAAPAPSAAEQTRTILDAIRLQGRRVSVHPRIGGVSIRATSRANSGDVVSAEINDPSQTAAINELRCAQALAKKLGLILNAGGDEGSRSAESPASGPAIGS